MDAKKKRFNIELSGEIVKMIDDYRRSVEAIPDQTKAIRELIKLGYEASLANRES